MSEATMTSSPPDAPAAPKPVSFWEDVIDIFVKPAEVFSRRVYASAWAPYLFVVIAMTVLTIGTFGAIEPAFEGEFRRNLPKMMAQNPQLTQEMADKMLGYQAMFARYVAGLAVAVAVLVVGALAWLIGRMFGAKAGFGAAMLIASYAYFPRVLGSIAAGVIALLSDPAKINSLASVSLSAARFLDPDTANPFVVALLMRLDLMVIWETVLLGIGMRVIGRLSPSKAVAFAITMWVVGSLYQLRQAYLLM